MPATFRQHVARLVKECPGIATGEAEWRLIEAYRSNCSEYPWAHFIKEGTITTEAPYSTGTVAVTNGDTAVTLTDGTWDTTWTNRKILLEGDEVPYGITIATASTGTLDRDFLGDTLTAGTYEIYREVYSLPSDCDPGRELIILDPEHSAAVPFVPVLRLQTDKRHLQGQTGTPCYVARWGNTSASPPVAQVIFGPYAPDSEKAYPIFYYKRAAAVSNLDTYPDWPEPFESIHWKRARRDWALSARGGRGHPLYALWNQEYLKVYVNMKAQMDGGVEMRNVVRGRYPRGAYGMDALQPNARIV